MSTKEALKIIEADYGDLDSITEEAIFDGICPAVCMVCGITTEMEPDQDRGWCSECNENSVKSLLILRGFI